MRFLLGVVLLAACSGETPPMIDANPLGPACNKATYDLCVEEHDCDSMNCINFAAEGFQVCTVACSTSTPCPDDKSGSPGTCSNNICVPSAPNMCHLGP
jgi:hypothetical protein